MSLSFSDPMLAAQAAEAGYADPEQYLVSLVEKDAERLAIKKGIDDADAGRVRPFEEFDLEFRAKRGLPPRNG